MKAVRQIREIVFGEMTEILGKIPGMKMRETITLWRNALGALDNPKKASQHQLAQQVIKAVGVEWKRRHRSKPIDPKEMFSWPSTEAGYGSGDLDTQDWLREGILKFMGYRVGNVDGEPQGIRERILTQIFSGPLPPVFPDAYIDEWGAPSTPTRLQKLEKRLPH